MSRPSRRPAAEPDVAEIAALIGDPGRAAMLFALLDGRELPAAELAARAGVSPQSATAHLKRLVAAGVLDARASGRHRLFRLHSAEVGHAMEALAAIARPRPIVGLTQSTALQRLRTARSCYDHLAGHLGVAVTDRLVENGTLLAGERAFVLTDAGTEFLHAFGVDVERARAASRSFARACTDWTERRPHLAGSLGAALLERFLTRGWVRRNAHERSLAITAEGRIFLARMFRIDV